MAQETFTPQLPRMRAGGRRRGRHRQSHHHARRVRASLRSDRDRASLRSDRRDIVVGRVARQGCQGCGGPHQPGRRHCRAQGRTGDRRYRIQSGQRRAQAAQPDPAHQRRIHRRLGSFRRDAGGDSDRDRTEDDLLSRPARRPRPRGARARASRSAPAPTPIRSPPPACRGASRTSARSGRSSTPTMPGARARLRNRRSIIERAGGKVLNAIPVPLDAKDFVPYLAQISAEHRGAAAGLHRLAVGCVLHPGQDHGPGQEDEDVFVVGQHRGDRARRHQGRGGRRVFLREFPAAARRPRTTVSTRSSTSGSASTMSMRARSAVAA